ncbi:arsenate reductase ArsC [Cohnella hongkongensis]|uniref:Arsenate reductase ArsC n=1 Tax=Cohnella hongkongensis TaxID=178337 RepID=A0ABV9FC69_9BACL
MSREKDLRIYFLCGQNRCRSQMAEAFAKHYGSPSVVADSAGLDPSPLHPLTVEAMREIGLDVSEQISKRIDMKVFLSATVIVKLCEDIQEKCPIVPFGIRNEQWNVADPLAQAAPSIQDVRKARDEIKSKVIHLLQQHQACNPTTSR